MKIAVVGCAHGELDKIYESVVHLEEKEQIKIDLLICCGDFQAIRNYGDLNCMAVPQNYRQLNTFYKYYSGQSKAPYLTLFVGGNHEATNFLTELPYGGWVAENIFYFGFANVLRFGRLRLAGLSGIFNGRDYFKGHFECPIYDEDTKRSAYHVRQAEIFRLKQLTPDKLNVFISHDWPRGIHAYGDADELFRIKPYFRDEALRGDLGSPPSEELLFTLKPDYWFAAHMHVKFPALIDHENGRRTRFLALDKCLPRRQFLQILDLADDEEERLELKYDPEWLAILKSTNHLSSTSNRNQYMPGPKPGGGSTIRFDFTPIDEEIKEIESIFDNDFKVPRNFRWTAPPLTEDETNCDYRQKFYVNPQTTEFCTKLGITNTNDLLARLKPLAVDEPYYLRSAENQEIDNPLGEPLENENSNRFPSVGADTENRLIKQNVADQSISEEIDNRSAVSKSIDQPSEIGFADTDPQEIKLEDDEDGDEKVEEMEQIDRSCQKRLLEEIDKKSIEDKSINEDEKNRSQIDNQSTDTLKRFKRRNADLYSTKVEDDDDA